ncbi:MAG: hypothetical protein M5R36_08285 [Deltaproteobacteria bacterium]|nr:hypothetical protein [Deltaproteobacteria bacterium]
MSVSGGSDLAMRYAGCLIYRNRWSSAKKAYENAAKNAASGKEAQARKLVYSTRVGALAKESYANRRAALEAAAKLAPGSKAAAEAFYTLGKFALDEDDFKRAATAYRRASEIAGATWMGRQALWYGGFAAYLAGDAKAAAEMLKGLYDAAPDDADADRALYWCARAEESLGRKDEAEQRYLQLVRDFDRTYYGLAAEVRLEGMGYTDFRERRALESQILQATLGEKFGVPTLDPEHEQQGGGGTVLMTARGAPWNISSTPRQNHRAASCGPPLRSSTRDWSNRPTGLRVPSKRILPMTQRPPITSPSCFRSPATSSNPSSWPIRRRANGVRASCGTRMT